MIHLLCTQFLVFLCSSASNTSEIWFLLILDIRISFPFFRPTLHSGQNSLEMSHFLSFSWIILAQKFKLFSIQFLYEIKKFEFLWGFFLDFCPLCIKSLFGFFRVMKERERVLLSNIEFCIFDDARWCRGGRKAEGP